MSIHLMNQAWRTTLATGAKFVLVAVCDTANDEGVLAVRRDDPP